jgi:hypothetical protein
MMMMMMMMMIIIIIIIIIISELVGLEYIQQGRHLYESCQELILGAKIRAFWVAAPCSLVGVDRRFGDVYLMMEAVRTPETSVYSNETTRRYIPDDYNFHTRRRENLKSHTILGAFATLRNAG